MLEDLDPGFDLLRNCNMSDTLRRDVSTFVLEHINSKEQPGAKPATFLKTTVVQRENEVEAEMATSQ